MSGESLTSVDFSRIVPDYESRFPMEMAVLRLGGVYPGETTTDFINPYTHEIDDEYFGNVGEHCLAVAHCAEVFARKFLGPHNPQTVTVTRRALIHDATKRFEVLRSRAMRAGLIDDAYSKSAYETIRPILERQGIAADTVDYMASSGSETGHNSLSSFVEIREGVPALKTQDNLAEMIVHLADDMTYTSLATAKETAETFYLTAPERMAISDFPNRYPFVYSEGFGFDQEGKVVLLKDVNEENTGLTSIRTYAEWQIWVAREISEHLVSSFVPDVPRESAELYLKGLANASSV